jgi:hypothetical protein
MAMRFRLTPASFGRVFAIVAAVGLSAPAAHAFTMEGGSGNAGGGGGGASIGGPGASSGGASNYTVPKWDLEEQARQFQSNGSATASSAGKNQFSTPFGNGTFELNVRQNNFSSPMSPTFGGSQTGATRQQFDRLTAPPGLQHLYDQ